MKKGRLYQPEIRYFLMTTLVSTNRIISLQLDFKKSLEVLKELVPYGFQKTRALQEGV